MFFNINNIGYVVSFSVDIFRIIHLSFQYFLTAENVDMILFVKHKLSAFLSLSTHQAYSHISPHQPTDLERKLC